MVIAPGARSCGMRFHWPGGIASLLYTPSELPQVVQPLPVFVDRPRSGLPLFRTAAFEPVAVSFELTIYEFPAAENHTASEVPQAPEQQLAPDAILGFKFCDDFRVQAVAHHLRLAHGL